MFEASTSAATSVIASAPMFPSHATQHASTASRGDDVVDRLRAPVMIEEGLQTGRAVMRDDRVQPADEIARHLVTVDLVEALMATVPIEVVLQVPDTCRPIGLEELFDIAADRIAGASEDVDRKLFGYAGLARGL